MSEATGDLMHLQRGLSAKPLCGINEPWRTPGEPETFIKTTTVYEEATCIDCKFQFYEGPSAYSPPKDATAEERDAVLNSMTQMQDDPKVREKQMKELRETLDKLTSTQGR